MSTSKRPGRWKPGESGNAAGRPPGSGAVAKLRAGIEAHVPEIIDKLVQQAKEGDAGAARLLLERVVPALKPTEQPAPIDMPDGSLADQARAVVHAAADGDLAPAQAAQIVTALGGVAKIIETTELVRRIEALEARNQGGKS
jgi:hypothetical protein